MWWRKREVPEPSDVAEARAQRTEALAALEAAQAQGPIVARLTAKLIERRDQNHFGDALQITFTARGHRV